jgi:short-subunit dehydrogenase involved in D-alanine esterification of teichoic acids
MKTTGNTILITGGSKGIGFGLAKKFSELGNKVVITGRDEDKLKKVVSQLNNAAYIKCDQSKQNDLDALLLKVQNDFPEINVLINNAGVQYNYSLVNEVTPFERIENEINTNLTSVIKLSSMFIPMLESKKESAIINVSSALAFVPKQSAPVYCATKAGIHSFTQVLRYQLDVTNIKVFELIPALVETEMTKGRGKDKISVDDLVQEFIEGFEKDAQEINIGKVKLLRRLNRFMPSLISKKMRMS